MECEDVDKLKPLNKLLDDQTQEFESGEEKKCDNDLDVMIWELCDYENEEPPQQLTNSRKPRQLKKSVWRRETFTALAVGLPSWRKRMWLLHAGSARRPEEGVKPSAAIRPAKRKNNVPYRCSGDQICQRRDSRYLAARMASWSELRLDQMKWR
ncbi:MAG: hypothetical protein ACLP9S_04915 [Syntrophales bacterium]|jgi:hypothetical protein